MEFMTTYYSNRTHAIPWYKVCMLCAYVRACVRARVCTQTYTHTYTQQLAVTVTNVQSMFSLGFIEHSRYAVHYLHTLRSPKNKLSWSS